MMQLTSAPLFSTGLYVALLLLLGYAIVCAVSEKNAEGPRIRHWAELYGFSFAAGCGAMSLLLFVVSLAGFAPNKPLLMNIAVVAIAGVVVLARQHQLLQLSVPTPRRKIDPLFFLGIAAALTVIAAAYNVQARSAWPGLGDIDAFAIWMFKAKWVSLAPVRPIPSAFHDPGLSYSHQDYPLGLPFLIAGIFAVNGGVSEEVAKTLLLPQYLALVAIIYSALRRFHRRAIAVTITAVFAAAPVLNKNAGLLVAETPLILAYAAAVALLLHWMETDSRGSLILTGFFGTVAAFSKNEGLALLPVIGVASLIFALTRRDGRTRKQRVGRWCIAAAVAIAVITPWLTFRNFLPRTHEDYGGRLRSFQTLSHNLPRLKQIIPAIFSQMFEETGNAGLIWYVLITAAVVGWRGFGKGSVRVLWTILISQLSLYTATFVVTPWNLDQLLGMIAPKLLVQATPVAALLIGLHLREIKSLRPK